MFWSKHKIYAYNSETELYFYLMIVKVSFNLINNLSYYDSFNISFKRNVRTFFYFVCTTVIEYHMPL